MKYWQITDVESKEKLHLTHARLLRVISCELMLQPPSCFLFQHLPVSKCRSGSYQLSVRNQKTHKDDASPCEPLRQISAFILGLQQCPTGPDMLAVQDRHAAITRLCLFFLSCCLWFKHPHKRTDDSPVILPSCPCLSEYFAAVWRAHFHSNSSYGFTYFFNTLILPFNNSQKLFDTW